MLRLAVGGYALANVFISTGEFARLSNRPARQFEPVGLAGLLDGPVSPVVLWALFVVSAVSGVAFVAGAAFRLSGPIFALASLAWATYHASWGRTSSTAGAADGSLPRAGAWWAMGAPGFS